MNILRYIRAQICWKLFWPYRLNKPEWQYRLCRLWVEKGWLNWERK